MRKAKTITIVLTLSTSIIIMLGYMIATNKLVGLSNNSPIIMLQDASIDNIAKVSSIELTKAKVEKENNQRTTTEVTSRSGFHTPITNTTQAEVTETAVTTDEITENVSEEPIEEVIEEPVEEEKPTYEGVELEYNARYSVCSSPLTKSKGTTYYNGHKETYYSQKVLPGKGLKMLNNNGRHVADDGTVRDADGYIAVACNYLSKGSEIMTSLGPGKVYDTGGMTGKWIDIYVNW